MPFGSFFMCIFIGYVWKTENAITEITNGGKLTFSWKSIYKIFVTVVDPLIILIVFLSGIGVLKF
jgi:NSS family neurotransmitter:Na+ symporter